MERRTGFVGVGMFGFVLARHLALKYPQDKFFAYDANTEVLENLKRERRHPIHFRDYLLPENVFPTDDLEMLARSCRIIILSLPAQRIRSAAEKLAEYIKDKTVLVNVAKGLEIGTGKRISEIVREKIDKSYTYAVISGGTIAGEMIRGFPLSAEVACEDEDTASLIQNLFSTERFRVYRNDDVTGVELAGALKNPLSIATGIARGFGFGSSTVGALVSRGAFEIKKLALCLGAKEKTFAFGGQAAMGDIMTSCFGDTRNRRFGELIIKEGSVNKALDIMKKEGKLVEGYYTSFATSQLSEKYGVEMPIQREVYQILHKGKDPRLSMVQLMTRTLKSVGE